jgi:D-threonate/D-erythronate kinase
LKPSSASAKSWIFAIADDLTGALEVGACFTGSVVSTNRFVSAPPDAATLVVDTETRHLPAKEAAAIVHEVVLSALCFHPSLIYKKTDSTLRGNIAAEFGALLRAVPGRALVYAPAYPQLGRTVKNGHLLVHGVPVHQTAFACDPLNPVLSSDIRALVGDLPVTILDGESIADLELAVQGILQQDIPAIAAGSAALVACLSSGETVPLPHVSRCLIVNGSMHPVSTNQIDFARGRDCFDDEWIYYEGTHHGEGLERAAKIGEQVRQTLSESHFDALVVFGGDTALGIHRALGSHDFRPCGEAAPGVPVSRCGDLLWITKAGGFGPPDLLCDIRRGLK